MFNRLPRNSIKRAKSGRGRCGIGSVILPFGVERSEYVETCYRTSTISAHLGFGYGSLHSIPVDSEVLQRIEIPKDDESVGSTIIWVMEETTEIPIVIGVLNSADDYQTLEQGMRRISSEVGLSSVEQVINANTPEFSVNVRGGGEAKPRIVINAVSASRESEVGISSDFRTKVHGDAEVIISSNEVLDFVVYEQDEKKLSCRYEKGVGFSYIDEFGNEIKCTDGRIDIKGENIVHNDGSQKMVLGDELVSTLKSLINAIKSITVPTPNGPSGTPINSAQFSSISNSLDKILSKHSKLK